MSRRALAMAVVILAVVLMAGCAASRGSAQTPVETNEVTMPPSYRFEPPVIRIPAGTTVTWHNRDNFSHSVSVPGTELPYRETPPGSSASITFETPGEYEYVCTYHAQNMKGRVIVVAP